MFVHNTASNQKVAIIITVAIIIIIILLIIILYCMHPFVVAVLPTGHVCIHDCINT